MTENSDDKKMFLNSSSGNTFAVASTNALVKNQYDVVKNSTGNFVDGIVYEVPIEDIDQDDQRYQMRTSNPDIGIVEKSILEDGQTNPVYLFRLKGLKKFIIIAGFSRTKTISKIKGKRVKAYIKTNISHSEALRLATRDNIARNNISNWDTVCWVDKLLKDGVSVKEVCSSIGRNHSTVSGYQKIYHSKEIITKALEKSDISISQAYTLSVYEDRLSETQLIEIILNSNKLSVKKLENAIEELLISSVPVKESTKRQRSKPKLAAATKVNNGGQYFNFSKIGDTINFNTKLIISKENSGEVIAKLEQAIIDIKGL